MTQVKNTQRRHGLVYKLHVKKVDLKHNITYRGINQKQKTVRKQGKELKYKYWENRSPTLTRDNA